MNFSVRYRLEIRRESYFFFEKKSLTYVTEKNKEK